MPEIVVEFVIAAGKKEQARGWVRVVDDGVVNRGDGAPLEPADVTFTARDTRTGTLSSEKNITLKSDSPTTRPARNAPNAWAIVAGIVSI